MKGITGSVFLDVKRLWLKQIDYHQLERRLRMQWATLPLSQTFSWRDTLSSKEMLSLFFLHSPSCTLDMFQTWKIYNSVPYSDCVINSAGGRSTSLQQSLTYFLILTIKANKMHYLSYLFDNVLYIFWTDPLSIIRNISTLYTRNTYLSC